MAMDKRILKEILLCQNKEKAKILARFFKTGKGQYGEGDIFLGITVPISRQIAKKYSYVDLKIIEKLIKNKYHEVRLISLLILVQKYKQEKKNNDLKMMRVIVDFYLKQTKYINNWDLVDLSAHYILGDYLTISKTSLTKNILYKLAKSKNLWEKRISIISTFAFIYKNESSETIDIVKRLLKDPHDLIHKACGWMLREVGKRVSQGDLTSFLDIYSPKMPRTMLRYAIERLPVEMRKYYLNKK